jgi:serine/threonine-protein kinase
MDPLPSESGDLESKVPTVLGNDSALTTRLAAHDLTSISSTGNEPPRDGETITLSPDGASRRDQPGPDAAIVCGYELLGVLGRGAMGIVYKALQPGLKRTVALKMILSGDLARSDELLRFQSEAQVIAQLQHPNIVQIFEIGNDAGRPFFSMEYVPGESLSKRIAATPQEPRAAARLLQTLANAVHAAHQKSIIHRDIKPANILIAEDGSPKLTDFGLAKTLEDHSGLTHTGAILGTPSYMAPEQAEGRVEEIGVRSDVYALGAVLYEMLTGRAPFKASSVLDTLQQVKTMEPVAPMQFAPAVPRDLETICLKCLQKDPARRYDSARALEEDLGRFLAGEAILARPISTPERMWRWCRRNPRVALLSGLVVAAVLAWGTTTSALAVFIKREKDNTEAARLEAVKNAQEARENAKQAERNAAEAREQKAAAQANADKAERNAKIARQNHQVILNQMLALGEKLQKRLIARKMGSAPEMRKVREDLLQLVRESMVSIGEKLDSSDVTTFAAAYAYQELGDLLVRLGLGEAALEQFRKAHDAIKKVADAQPENDKARGNLAVMFMRLGDIAFDLLGDAPTAVRYHRDARALLKEIEEHPRTDASLTSRRWMVSHADMHLGNSLLALGDTAGALKCFQDSLANRQYWWDQEPNSVEAESYVCQAYVQIGVVAARLGDAEQSRKNFTKAVEICESLVKRFPKSMSFHADLADVYGLFGDAQALFNELDAAAASYQKSREQVLIVLNHDTESTAYNALQAMTHERLAQLAKLRRQVDEARNRFAAAEAVRADMCQIEPNNRTWKAAHGLALARTGKTVEAAQVANTLAEQNPTSAWLLLQAARIHSVCAANEMIADKKRRAAETALGCLEKAVAAGWKDPRFLETDPDLAAVRELPNWKVVLGKKAN